MGKATGCLSVDQMSEFVSGSSTVDDGTFAAHLESCQQCQASLEHLNSGQMSSELLTGNSSLRDKHSPELSAVMQSLASLPGNAISATSQNKPSDEKVDLTPWLEPSQNNIGYLAGYELMQQLGQGGMGVVYLAREPELERLVGLKILRPELATQDSARNRFLKEARVAASIKHPNVVAIHRVESEFELPFLVLEYVEGGTLEEMIDGFDHFEKLLCAKQIASAVAAAHRMGIIHRDIKPSNILIDRESKTAKLTDFGLAKLNTGPQYTQTGIVAGTPGYIAPEVLAGQSKPNELSDIFSLGVTLRRIFPPANEQSRWIEAIVESSTQHNPNKRPTSARSIADAITVQRFTPVETVNLRRKLFLAVVSIAALAICFLAWQFQKQRPRTFSVSNSHQLADAIENAPSGSTILLATSTNAYEIVETTIKQDSLTICGQDGSQANIQFKPKRPDNLYPMLRVEGDLVLTSVKLVYKSDDDDSESLRSLIQLEQGSLIAKNCRFVLGPTGTIINASEARAIKLVGCQLHTLEGVAINCDPAAETNLDFERCVFTGASVVDLQLANSVQLRVHRCTIFAEYFIDVSTESWIKDPDARLNATASQNIFSTSSAVLGFDHPELSKQDFTDAITWVGKYNVFNGSIVATYGDTKEFFPGWAGFGTPWNEITDERESTFDQQPFSLSNDSIESMHLTNFDIENAAFTTPDSLDGKSSPSAKPGAID